MAPPACEGRLLAYLLHYELWGELSQLPPPIALTISWCLGPFYLGTQTQTQI